MPYYVNGLEVNAHYFFNLLEQDTYDAWVKGLLLNDETFQYNYYKVKYKLNKGEIFCHNNVYYKELR
jgi:hypothetical protein